MVVVSTVVDSVLLVLLVPVDEILVDGPVVVVLDTLVSEVLVNVAVALAKEVVNEELLLLLPVEAVDPGVELVDKLLLDVLVTVDVADEDVGETALIRKIGLAHHPG